MNEELPRFLPILFSNLAAGVVLGIANRWVKPGYFGQAGLYLIVLPLGFNCFGWDLDPLFIAGSALIGIFALLFDIHRNFKRTKPLTRSRVILVNEPTD